MSKNSTKSVKNGNKKSKESANGKETQFTEKLQVFRHFSKTLFGDLQTAFIEKKLKGLSQEKQYDLTWHILHYMYHDEILLTGNQDLDIRLSEIIEKLPIINVELFRHLSRDKIKEMRASSDKPQYAN